jgi:hypothetical protein
VRCTFADGRGLEHGDLAIDSDGALYLTDTTHWVRRYRVERTLDTCALHRDPTFDQLRLPDQAPPEDRLLGARVSWQLSAGPNGAVYAFDLGHGIHRVDHGKLEPVCPRTQTNLMLFDHAGRVRLDDSDGALVDLAHACKEIEHGPLPPDQHFWGFGDAPVGLVDDDVMIVDKTRNGRLVRIDPKGNVVALFGNRDIAEVPDDPPERIAAGIPCPVLDILHVAGEVVVFDVGCMRVAWFKPDGAFVRAETLNDSSGATGHPIWWHWPPLARVATTPDGGIVLLAFATWPSSRTDNNRALAVYLVPAGRVRSDAW